MSDVLNAPELCLPGEVVCLDPGLGTHAFNGAVVEAWGRLLAVYRLHRRPSVLALSELDDQLRPFSTRILWDLADGTVCPEDPRAVFDAAAGRLHVLWTGVRVSDWSAAQMYHTELDRNYRIRWNTPCWYRRAGTVEKNWSPFLHEGRLRCLYEYRPLTILEHTGCIWRLVLAKDIPIPWSYGPIHGGAPPVWRDGCWYCFFQSSWLQDDGEPRHRLKIYHAGCAVFNADWDPIAVTAEPILAGSRQSYTDDNPWCPGDHISVVFPCGAIRRGPDWLLSYGWNDKQLRVARIPAAAVDEALGMSGSRKPRIRPADAALIDELAESLA